METAQGQAETEMQDPKEEKETTQPETEEPIQTEDTPNDTALDKDVADPAAKEDLTATDPATDEQAGAGAEQGADESTEDRPTSTDALEPGIESPPTSVDRELGLRKSRLERDRDEVNRLKNCTEFEPYWTQLHDKLIFAGEIADLDTSSRVLRSKCLELQRCDLQLQVLVGLDITQEALKPVFDLIENGLDQVLDQITIDTRSCCGMLCFKSPTQATKTDQALRKANRDIEPLLHELQQQVADGLETIALELKEVESIADELKSSSPEPSPGITNTLKEMNEIQIEFGKDSNAEHDDVEENSETPMLSGEVESPDDNTGETDRWAKISLIVSKKMKVKHIIAAVNACLANADGIDMQIESLVPLWTQDYSAFNTDKKIIKLLKHSVNLSGEEYDARQEDPVKLVGIDHEQFNAEVWSQHLDFSGAEFVTYTAEFGEVSDDSDSDSDDDDLELHIGLRLQL